MKSQSRHNHPFAKPQILYWIALISLAVAFAIAMPRLLDATGIDALTVEGFKLVLQVMVVGMFGGLVKMEIDAQRERSEFRREVLSKLSAAHDDVYAVRRRLVIHRDDPRAVEDSVFTLMGVRNKLGTIGHEVRLRRDIGQGDVGTNIVLLRDFLETLIDESIQRSEGGVVAVGPRLEAFAAGAGKKAVAEPDIYLIGFKAPYLLAKCAADPGFELNDEQLATIELLQKQNIALHSGKSPN